jgi:hypothetical protein
MEKCQVCQVENATEIVKIAGQEYHLCGFDALKADRFIHSMIHHEVINISWGCGRIDYGSWCNVRDALRKYNIKEVLELGFGLSTELFVNEGIRVTGFDVHSTHVKVTQELNPIKSMSTLHHYQEVQITDNMPATGFVRAIYPGRKWDFVFVDGPHVRKNEVKEAMEVSNRFIYLHDPNLGEETFFPNAQWKAIDYKLYERVV